MEMTTLSERSCPLEAGQNIRAGFLWGIAIIYRCVSSQSLSSRKKIRRDTFP